jgi:hypothetical protein
MDLMQAIMLGVMPPPKKENDNSVMLNPIAEYLGTRAPATESPLELQKLQMSGSIPVQAPPQNADVSAKNYFDGMSGGLEQQKTGLAELEKLVREQNKKPDGTTMALAGLTDMFNNTNYQAQERAGNTAGQQQFLGNMQAVQKAKEGYSDKENDIQKAILTHEQSKEKALADREQFKLLLGLKRDAAGNSAENKNFKQEQSIFQDWSKHDTTKSSNNVNIGYQKVLSAANNPSAAGDLSLVFGYMKMLDPGSVVREQEFKSAAEARAAISRFSEKGIPLPAFIVQGVQKLESGEFLLPEQRADFAGQAKNVYSASLAAQKNVDKAFESRARDLGIEPARVVKSRELFGDAYDEKPKARIMSKEEFAKSKGYTK